MVVIILSFIIAIVASGYLATLISSVSYNEGIADVKIDEAVIYEQGRSAGYEQAVLDAKIIGVGEDGYFHIDFNGIDHAYDQDLSPILESMLPFNSSEIDILSRTIRGEANNTKTTAEKAAVALTILNRFDQGYGNIEKLQHQHMMDTIQQTMLIHIVIWQQMLSFAIP